MDSNKVKKSVRCPPDYLQFNNSSASGMANEGNPPDRGPPGTPVTTNVSKKVIKTPSVAHSGSMSPSLAPGVNSPLSVPQISLSKLSNYIQNAVFQMPTTTAEYATTKHQTNPQTSGTSYSISASSGGELSLTESSNLTYNKAIVSHGRGSSNATNANRRPAATVTSQSSSTIMSSLSPNTMVSSRSQLASAGSRSSKSANLRPSASATSATFFTKPSVNNEHRVHWEVQCAKQSTVLTTTSDRVEKLRRVSNAKRAEAQLSSKQSTIYTPPVEKLNRLSNLKRAETIRNSSLHSLLFNKEFTSTSPSLTNNPFKRKLEVPLNSDITKKRKTVSNVGVKRNYNTPVLKQWPNLLASVLQRMKSLGTKDTQHSTALTPQTTSLPSILPTPNSLLMKYDPIKILNRPCLLGSMKTSQPNVGTSHSASKTDSHIQINAPTSSQPAVSNDKISENSQSQESSTCKLNIQPSLVNRQIKQTCIQKQKELFESIIMPPPKFPPPWSQKKKVDSKSRVAHRSHLQGLLPSTSSAAGSSKGTIISQRSHKSSKMLTKLNLSLPNGLATKSLELSYEAESQEVSQLNLRIATVACARKIARKNRVRWLVRKGKLKKEVNRPLNSPLTSLLKPAKSKTITLKLSDKAISKKAHRGSNPVSTEKPETPTPSSSNIKPKEKKICWKKNPDVMLRIPGNPLVDHAIELLRDKRELQKRLELIEDESIIYRLKTIPKLKTPIPKGRLLEQNIPLTSTQTKKILQKRLAVVLAHGGFTHANLRPIEVLADVMENFFIKMTHRLKQVTEMEMSGCEQEFPDPLERVLVEMGLGGVRGAEEFYQSRVVDYRKRLEEQCITLRDEYSKKVRLKVGKGFSTPGGCNSTSSSSSTSCQPVSPGNSVLAEILSGLEGPTASLHLGDEARRSVLQSRPQILTSKLPQQLITTQSSPMIPKFHQPSSSSSRAQNISDLNPSQNPVALPIQLPTQVASPNLQQSPYRSIPINARSGKPKSFTIMQGGSRDSTNSPLISYSSSMVSINLNNNLDLGGYATIPSSGNNILAAVNQTTGHIVGSNSNSKAKLKEALSQRNLLRLNFEQGPSNNCDSAVLLSSSSPSLSASSAPSKSSK